MTENNFLFKFSNIPQVSSNTPSTLPPQKCTNGMPIDDYSGTGVYAWQVLYSIWNNYQSTIGAQFTIQQCLTNAPNSSPITTTGPANIFVIRHGEKNSGSYCLNNNGIYRACKIVDFVNQLAENGYPISYIISSNPCPYNSSNPSMRNEQTVIPASFMLNIPMFIYGGSQDFDAVTSQLFGNDQYNGLNVLIAWEHSAIQQLCLNILDSAGGLAPSRLPTNISTGDEFFNLVNPCPNGNYVCNDPSNTAYYLPNKNPYPQGVGNNSQTYPYWQTSNFNNVFWFNSSSANNYIFDFKIFNEGEKCLTCAASCPLLIGLYQPLQSDCHSSYNYYYKTPASENIESQCEVPSDWATN